MRRNIPMEPLEATLPSSHHFVLRECWIDEHGIHLEYSIRPAVPMPSSGRPLLSWDWSALDDLGNEYESCGGAYGPAPDGTRTDGVLSLRRRWTADSQGCWIAESQVPMPPASARRLTASINPWYDPAFETRPWLQFDLVLGE